MKRFSEAFSFSFYLMMLMWAIFIFLEAGLGIVIGIEPRSVRGLIGIPFSAFFHADSGHISANTAPLFVLGLLFGVECRSRMRAAGITLLLSCVGGIIVWCIGGKGLHLGASMLIFAYFGFLVSGLWHDGKQRVMRLALAVFTIVLYGTLVFAFFHVMPGISWSAHFGGAVAGCVIRRFVV